MDILRTHINGTFHANLAQTMAVAMSCCPAPVSAIICPTESTSKEDLAQGITDLVRSRAVQILSLEPDVRSSRVLG
jgi:hypothetical protein